MAYSTQLASVASEQTLVPSFDPNFTLPSVVPSPPPSDGGVSDDEPHASGPELDVKIDEFSSQRDTNYPSLHLSEGYHSLASLGDALSDIETESSPTLRSTIIDNDAEPKYSITPSPIYVGLNKELDENPHIVLVTTAVDFLTSLQGHDELLNDMINFCAENGKLDSARDDEILNFQVLIKCALGLAAIFHQSMMTIIEMETTDVKKSRKRKIRRSLAKGISGIAQIMTVLQEIMDVHASEISNLELVIQRHGLSTQLEPNTCGDVKTNNSEEVHVANTPIRTDRAQHHQVLEALHCQMQNAKCQNKRIDFVAKRLGVLEYSNYKTDRPDPSYPVIVLRKKEAINKSDEV